MTLNKSAECVFRPKQRTTIIKLISYVYLYITVYNNARFFSVFIHEKSTERKMLNYKKTAGFPQALAK